MISYLQITKTILIASLLAAVVVCVSGLLANQVQAQATNQIECPNYNFSVSENAWRNTPGNPSLADYCDQVAANREQSQENRQSNLECGNDGVRLGVGINDDQDCIGQGEDNPIFEYLGGIVRFLSIGVGIVVTAMIIVGGIQYSTAGGNPQAVEAAKQRIYNAIIALVLYIFMVGIINFLVPGGVL